MWGRKEDPAMPLASTLGSPSDLPSAAVPDRPAAVSSGTTSVPGGPERGRNLAQIGKSLKLKGEITGSEDLYIDGEVEGTVELKEHSLTVGPNGKVHADVSARSITILGRLQGNVKAGERIEIRKTGSLEGDLSTARIVIEDGAVFRGSIDIVKPGQNAANAPAASVPASARPAGAHQQHAGPSTPPRIVAAAPNARASTAPKTAPKP
jgi:cytoskeletal protein CcmA (bactofilin family)